MKVLPMRAMRAFLRQPAWMFDGWHAGSQGSDGLNGKASGHGDHASESLDAGQSNDAAETVVYPLPVTYPQPAPWQTEGMGCVAVIGNFDGVHAGHVALLALGQRLAQAKGLPLVALTFEPHPRSVLKPTEPLIRLTTLAQKTWLLQAAGAAGVAIVPFDMQVAGWTPEYFMDEVLRQWLGAESLVVGENFRFGTKGAGDVETLRVGWGEENVHMLPLVRDGAGVVISSSAMRLARG